MVGHKIENKVGFVKNGSSASLLSLWPAKTKLIKNDPKSIVDIIINISCCMHVEVKWQSSLAFDLVACCNQAH